MTGIQETERKLQRNELEQFAVVMIVSLNWLYEVWKDNQFKP